MREQPNNSAKQCGQTKWPNNVAKQPNTTQSSGAIIYTLRYDRLHGTPSPRLNLHLRVLVSRVFVFHLIPSCPGWVIWVNVHINLRFYSFTGNPISSRRYWQYPLPFTTLQFLITFDFRSLPCMLFPFLSRRCDLICIPFNNARSFAILCWSTMYNLISRIFRG